MATPADQRLLELLDKWLKSLELHLKYSSLDDDTYFRTQPWPDHQRPSRWILDLAKQKAIALRDQVEERIGMGDTQFSESLELMTFLANLVGVEHIERFIPLASADAESAPVPAPGPQSVPGDAATGTREMPAFLRGTGRTGAPSGTDQVARSERKAPLAKPAAKAPARPQPTPSIPDKTPAAKPGAAGPMSGAPQVAAPARPSASDKEISSAAMRELVIADAARLVQWGRKWYELAELISSMADRPCLTDVRRILKDNKTVIDEKAGRG